MKKKMPRARRWKRRPGEERGGSARERKRGREREYIFSRVGPMPSSSTKMKSGSLSFFPFSSHPLLVIPLLSVLFYFSFSFTRRRFSRSRWSRSEIVADAKTSSVRYVCVCVCVCVHRDLQQSRLGNSTLLLFPPFSRPSVSCAFGPR